MGFWFRRIDRVFKLFEGLLDPFEPQPDYEPPARLIPYVWYYVGQAKWAFLAMLIFGFVSALVEALMFSYVGQLVDLLTAFEASGGKSGGWQGLLAAYGPTLLGMLFVVAIFRLLIITLEALFEEQVIVPGFFTLVRWQSYKHVIGQSLSFFQNDLAGRISQKVFQSGQATGDMMVGLLQVIWFIAVYAVTTAGVLFSLDWQLGLIVVVWIGLFTWLAAYFVPKVREHARKTADTGSGVSGRMVDAFANVQTVKLYGAARNEKDGVKPAMLTHRAALFKFTRTLTGLRVSANLVNGLAISMIGFVVVTLWLEDQTTLGAVAFVMALSLRMRLLLNRLLGNLNSFFRNVGITQNTMDLVARPHEIRDAPDAKPFLFRGGHISIRDLQFRYDKRDGVLDGISLDIKPGERVGIVGPSGAGKTTLVHLLMRFFEPEGGTIKIDGQEVTKVQQDTLRAHFSLVQQDMQLFHASVFENIAYGEPNADRERVVKAAEDANAHDFILDLQDDQGRIGYEARVGERGVKLSGGQRQRIAIARALYRDAPILVLDEATSQLDSGVEEAIQENLARLMEGKTVLVIAHRLSTVASLDRLIVLDKGRIVEQGDHQSLLAQQGLYAELWEKQSRLKRLVSV